MVTRYGGRKEPTMHCFMSHCAHPPPQHPPPPLSQFRIISAANAGRPDVGFHVTGTGFPQQQGGGAGPPTPQLRGIHHPHHGGNPSIPPQQPPPAPQSQHTGGPPGPAPTSTPPGPAEMGKQGPPHMQGQPQMQQGGQVQLSFVPNQTRATSSQPYFQPRPPAPRISNRNQVVNMQPSNVGQQIFPHQVQVSQMQMYGQQVMPPQIQTQHMFVPSQLPAVFGNQTRHQNHTGSGYYQQNPQQVMMAATQPLYPGFQHSQPQYYFQSAVSIPRPGGGVAGGPGPGGLTTAPSQVITAGGPPTQLGQPGGPVTMGLVQGAVGVPGMAAGDTNVGQTTVSLTSGKQTRRKHALDIVDPRTMKHVDIYDGSAASSSTPPRSGDSSARDTPQPNTDPGASAVAAEFAARVAKVASDKSSPPPPPPPVAAPAYVESPPTTNGPMNSIPTSEGDDAPSLSKEIVVVEENVTEITCWKPSPMTCSKPSGNSDISNEAAAMELESPIIVEFVPSVSAAEIKISPVKDSELTPVVSAQTNAPAVDVVRSNRDQFPALKSSAPAHQSPRRKQQQQQRPEIINVPQSTLVAMQPTLPPASRETTPTAEVKVSKKPVTTDEPTLPSSTFPVPQPPKEKREHGRDRDKSSIVSSQGRSEREKSVSSTSSSSSTGREREKSSREKEKAKDRDKSASQGRDREKSSTKEATPVMLQPQTEPAPQLEEPKQQTNGEMAAVETTESKTSQRSKQKQRNLKMRDINRKGAEKEGGTEMDAFVETPSEDVIPPASPSAPAPSQPATQVPAAPTNKVIDNQIVEDEETETDKEEKLVAARNQENTKVSAAALKEDTPVIENKATTLALKYSYKEDQWSPQNPDGKKKYERDFLMELQNDPQSKKKPDNLPDLEVVLKDNTNRRMGDRQFANMNRSVPERSGIDTFAPVYMRTHNSRGSAVPKRNSQQGKPKGGKQNVIHVRLSLNDDVKLNETENAWKPTRMKAMHVDEEETKTQELYKKVRGVLNKLTPQKFNTLVTQVQSLPIDTSERLQGVINLVFEKAVDEPSFSVAYAEMCKVLQSMQVPTEQKSKDEQPVNFRKLLVNRCQQEFEKSNDSEAGNKKAREDKMKEIEETTDPEKKKELQVNYDEEERRNRMKSVGNIRFIGELFKLQMLTTNIMIRCIKHLLSDGIEESLECLCKLLTTVGKDLEIIKGQDLSHCFKRMKEISQQKGSVSSRVRFMLQDVIELRQSKWIPRRDDSNPKTMDQIQKEAEKEELNQQAILNSAPQTPRRQDDRNMLSRKNRVGGVGEDGWNMVTPGRQQRYTVDTSKLKLAKEESSSLSLGQLSMHSVWSKGASLKGREMTVKPMTGGTYSSNMYAALDTSNEDPKRQAPPPIRSRPGAGGKLLTTTPAFKATEGDNRTLRGGSSRSSSRDNSARGGGVSKETTSLRPYAPSSQPPSMSASTEDISGSGIVPSKGPTTLSSVASKLSEEEVQKKTHSLLEEFLCNTDYKESESLIEESFSAADHSTFVRETLNDMLERTSSARINVGQLMSHVIKSGTISFSSYLAGLNEFLGFADDIAIDVPKFWPYIAEVIVPLLSSETMSFAELRKVAHPTHGNLIAELLDLLVKDKGPGWIQEKWNAADLKCTDFVPEDEVDNFVKRYKLDYVLGGASTAPSASSSVPVNWDHVQQKLKQFLEPKQASLPTFDQICAWIGANVGDKVKEPKFIRALMTALCETGIDSQKTTMKLNENHLQQHQKLVVKYVDNKEERELQCLFAIQSLINQLEHPQGLLCQIFQVLWDNSIISNDSFITWQESTDPAEQVGKGVALKSLTTFFTALREGDEDSSCDES